MRHAVLLSGSRKWSNAALIERRLRQYPAGTILIHGDCVGADRIADSIGRALRFHIHAYPYFHDLDLPGGPYKGGPIRNECMFDHLLVNRRYGYLCHFEAFPLPDSKGTVRLINHVERYNKRAPASEFIPYYVAA